MSAPDPRIEECFSCFGEKVDYDHEAQKMCWCTACGGRGEVIVCLGVGGPNTDCGNTVAWKEFEAHGAFCAECRAKLADHAAPIQERAA